MDELIVFDHAQADKLRSRLINKTKTIQLALCKIEGLVVRTANQHWEGKTRTEYINLCKSSCAQAHNYLRKWLKEVIDLINRTKEEKENQEKTGSVRQPRQLIEHVPDDTFKYVAGPAATADGQAGSGAAAYNSSANESADGQASQNAAIYDSSLNERAERGNRQISLSEVMAGALGYWYEPTAGKWFERLRIYDPVPTIVVREIEPPERKPEPEPQSSANHGGTQSSPAQIPEITERELYSLLQSYAGPADNGGDPISQYSPDDWLDLLKREPDLCTPEQLEAYNSVVAAGNYTDEQKRRMLISIALGTNINDLLGMDSYEVLETLKGLMDGWYNQSADVSTRLEIMLRIKWSENPDVNAYIISALKGHFEKLMLSTPSAPSVPSTPDNSQSHPGYSNAAHLAKLGYTEQEISELRSWMTASEWEFFNKLDGTEEGYIEAFKTDPNDLSGGVTLALSRYSARLLELDEKGNASQDSCRQIELFTNAILKSTTGYIFITEDGTKLETTRRYSDIYLERMYAGSALEAESAALMLALMDKGTPEYEELYKEYLAKYSMTSYWASQNLIIDEIKRRNLRSMGYEDVLFPEVSNLHFKKGEALFSYSHASGNKNEKVRTDLIKTGSIMHAIYNQQTLKRLQKAKDAVLGYAIAAVIQGGFLLVAGIISPPLAIVASLMFMAMKGAAGAVSGLDKIIESNAAAIGLKSGNLLAAELINGLIKWQKANQELDAENFKQKMEFFGTGGIFKLSSDDPLKMFEDVSMISFAGLYNPDIIRNMNIWEAEGIKGWANLTDEECKEIIDEIAEREGIDSQVYKDCCTLMYGGYDIFGIGVKETEDGIKNDMLRFLNAIIAFGLEDLDVKAEWTALFKDMRIKNE